MVLVLVVIAITAIATTPCVVGELTTTVSERDNRLLAEETTSLVFAGDTTSVDVPAPAPTTTENECGICQGVSCDQQYINNEYTCEYLEKDLDCDCSGCECPHDCFDVYDITKGEGTCETYASNGFCDSYFCPTCNFAGLCDYSCKFGNCDTTTTTTTTTTDLDTTTLHVTTTRPLYFELIYDNSKTTCNNIYKMDTPCNSNNPCSIRECWVSLSFADQF